VADTTGGGAQGADRAVQVVAFDVNETLFSLARMRPAFEGAGLDPALVPLWFSRVLRDGFALTAAGGFTTFRQLAASALRDVAQPDVDDEQVLAAFAELEPHPDVEPAFTLLREAGVRMVTLTNGAAALTVGLLERAGLAEYVERCLSVEEVRRWKPAPEPYLYAARECGVAPERIALVAAHAWDCDGARRAGLRTGWVSRLEGRPPEVFARADVEGDDLVEVARGLLALRPPTSR
jgi:2-haloacid dehalogenase